MGRLSRIPIERPLVPYILGFVFNFVRAVCVPLSDEGIEERSTGLKDDGSPICTGRVLDRCD